MTERDVLKKADRIISKGLKTELKAQGHYLTGALESSLVGTIIQQGNITILQCVPPTYAFYLHFGVKPARVPFREGSGAGHSKYIEGLTKYFILRGLSPDEAKSAAFATAKKHKKEGISTEASRQYSKTGERQDFINIVNRAITPELNASVLTGYDQLVNQTFNKTKSETI